jgi:hypothetical protein
MFMFVLYPPIVLWRGMQCQLNDIFLIVVGLSKVEMPSMSSDVTFRIGNSKLDEFEDNAVGVCLTEKVKQDLNDVSDPNTERSMTVALNDIYTGISDLTITYKYGVIIFGLDAFFSWLIGVMKGIMNLQQVMDLSSCKLPSFENNNVGSCVCGDNPGRIPQKQRESTETDSMWCRGLLLMNDIDGMDLLVWNPYSFEQLLKRNNAQDYFLCLKNRRTECTILKPVDPTFETQGVDVLQVISRCRTNYQQKKWDEAAVMRGLRIPLQRGFHTSNALLGQRGARGGAGGSGGARRSGGARAERIGSGARGGRGARG